MRVNYDLVRTILTEVADAELGKDLSNYNICTNENPDIVGWHIGILVQQGYLTAIDVSSKTEPYDFADVQLTLKGDNLLSKIESPAIWSQIKNYLQENSLSITFRAIEIAIKSISKS